MNAPDYGFYSSLMTVVMLIVFPRGLVGRHA